MKEQQNTKLIGALAVALSAMLWGVDGILLTPQLYNLNTAFVVFVIHLFPFLLMNVFFFREYRQLRTMSKTDLIYFTLIALFGGALGTLAIVKSLFLMHFNSLSVIVLLQKLQPVFAVILARIILKEHIKRHFVLWASIALIAGYFMTFGWALPDFTTEGVTTVYAALLSLLAAFSFGSSTVFSKKILGNYSFVSSTFFRYGFTTLIMLLIVLFSGHIGDFSQITPRNWLFIALIGLTTGSGAIFLYYYGLRHVKASLSTFLELMYPITAVILDYFVNKTVYSPVQWIAISVMLFAIVMLNVEKEK
ncbi:MAG: DMT family transporter [Bacteroidales bacterium]|jgi:drug/metabolite transporter (DMT)-like permease|nr:DMT family transporter [Bacteroidales bacterium]